MNTHFLRSSNSGSPIGCVEAASGGHRAVAAVFHHGAARLPAGPLPAITSLQLGPGVPARKTARPAPFCGSAPEKDDTQKEVPVTTHTKGRARRRVPDPNQFDLLALMDDPETGLIQVPAEPATGPGAMEMDDRIRDLLNQAIRTSAFNREQIAASMTALAGREITKAQLDSWTGASRPNRFPADLAPAFCAATGNTVLLQGMAEAAGCRLVERQELQYARLGQLWFFIRYAHEQADQLARELPLFREVGHA